MTASFTQKDSLNMKVKKSYKLKEVIRKLENDNGKLEPLKRFKISFDDGTDAISYQRVDSKSYCLEFIDRDNVNFTWKDKEAEITLGELGINRFSSLKVEIEDYVPADGMAAIMVSLDYQKYIEFKEGESFTTEDGTLTR
jgi:hypothetical protein